MPFIARCLKTNKRSNRHANLGNPGLEVDAQAGPVVVELVANAVVVLDVGVVDSREAGGGVSPEQGQETRKAVFDGLEFIARNGNSGPILW